MPAARSSEPPRAGRRHPRQQRQQAIKEQREPNASLAQVLPCMRVLGKLEQIIDPGRKAHA